MSRLEEMLGLEPPRWQPQPYRPRDNACCCCRMRLQPDDLAFCARCERHPLGQWCAPMRRPEPVAWDSEDRRWRTRKEVAAEQQAARCDVSTRADEETDVFGAVQPDKSKYDLESDKYIVKLVKLEPCTSQFGNGEGIKWYFQVARRGDPPEVIYTADGEKYELWQFSDATLTPSSKPGKWASALLQRELRVGEDGEAVANELVGKTAVALIGPNPKSGRQSILSMDPYRKGQAVVKPEPAPVLATAVVADDSEAF